MTSNVYDSLPDEATSAPYCKLPFNKDNLQRPQDNHVYLTMGNNAIDITCKKPIGQTAAKSSNWCCECKVVTIVLLTLVVIGLLGTVIALVVVNNKLSSHSGTTEVFCPDSSSSSQNMINLLTTMPFKPTKDSSSSSQNVINALTTTPFKPVTDSSSSSQNVINALTTTPFKPVTDSSSSSQNVINALTTTPFKPVTACKDLLFNTTADEELWLYADGEQIRYHHYWPTTITVTIPETTKVLAAKIIDTGYVGGFIGGFSDGNVTDSSWKCTRNFDNQWKSPTFDDSAWPAAVATRGQGNENNDYRWGIRPNIPMYAKWIWADSYGNFIHVSVTVYCRKRLACV